jgi:hypothetical protein
MKVMYRQCIKRCVSSRMCRSLRLKRQEILRLVSVQREDLRLVCRTTVLFKLVIVSVSLQEERNGGKVEV